MTYTSLSHNPRKFYTFTGVTVEHFNQLAIELERLWEAAEKKRLSRADRKRAIGAGGKYTLRDFKEKLLVVLVYHRLYVTYEVLQEFFTVHFSNLNRLVNRLEPLMAKHLKPRIPRGLKKRIGSWDEFCAVYPDLVDIVIDATEQRLQQPKGWKRQKRYYSGKSKKHAMKTQIAVSRTGKIVSVSSSAPGSVHDYTILKKSSLLDRFPEQTIKRVDLGYLGITNDFPDHSSVHPHRKRRKSELTKTEKRENRVMARKRIIVEHVIAKLKKFQILAQTYRNRRKTYNTKFQIIAGLVNLRLSPCVA